MNRNAARAGGAIAYLHEHAIDQSIALKYELGFVADPLPGDEQFRGMLSIPYLTPSGCQAIKFRALLDGGAKYAQAHGQKGRLYNTLAYFEAGSVIGIAEGEMDSIAATEHLGVPTLGVPGVSGWKESWRLLLKDFQVVFLFGDGDEPGKQFTYNLADKIGWRARIVPCPEGEDVSSMVAAGRVAELQELISTSNEEDEDA